MSGDISGHGRFDFGGVVVDWDLRHLFRRVFDDEADMERFLGTVLTPEQNLRCDLGLSLGRPGR